MITIRGVSKRFGARPVLSDVSFNVEPGEVTLLLGANGAGKSTLLRCILGLQSFDGAIAVAGRDPRADGTTVRSLIGYMPQSGGLHGDLTVDETMRLFAGIRRAAENRIAPLLREAGLSAEGPTRVADLSGGMRQRLGFALALLTDPPIVVLDEPSSSLDAASQRWLAGRLRELAADGRTVFVSTHASQNLFDAVDARVTIEDGRVTVERFRPVACNPAGRTEPAAEPSASVRPLIEKELRDALRNRWLTGYAVLLGVLGLAATATGLDSVTGLGLQSFGRTTATLTNLCLLLAPLVAVLMGAASVAGERDRGTLEHLLAQPLARSQLLAGKHAALLLALTLATLAGFLPAGLVVSTAGGPGMLAHYLLFPMLAMLAAGALAGVGLVISVTSRSAVQAQGTAVVVWCAMALLYDLILIGWLAASGLPAAALAASLIANPIDAARVLAVLSLEPDLYMLGPAGAYLAAALTPAGAASVLIASIACWIVAPVGLALRLFCAPLIFSGRKFAYESIWLHVHGRGSRTAGNNRLSIGRGISGL